MYGSLKITSDDFTNDLADPTSAAFKTKAEKYGAVVSLEINLHLCCHFKYGAIHIIVTPGRGGGSNIVQIT